MTSVFSSRPLSARSAISDGQRRVHHFAVVSHGGEVVGVRVEAAAIDLHEAHALLDQPPASRRRGRSRCRRSARCVFVGTLSSSKASRAGLRISVHGVVDRRSASTSSLSFGDFVGEPAVELAEHFQPLVAADLGDAGREGQVRVLLAGAADEVGFALLAEVAGPRGWPLIVM